jgi:hypothetical protein
MRSRGSPAEMECFVCYGGWMERDWRERRVERLEQRVFAIEEARREERQQAWDRRSRLLTALIWIECAVLWAGTVALLASR